MSKHHFVQDLSKGILGKSDRVELWEAILGTIPTKDLKYNNQKFLFLAFGQGTEVKVMAKILINAGWTKAQIKRNFYLVDKYSMFTNVAKAQGFKNVYTEDFLEWETDMKFDCVIGNPPYHKGTGNNGKGQTLWDLFVIKSHSLLCDNGYLGMIHPAGWRNVDGSFSDVKDILLSMEMRYLSINNIKSGKEVFGAATRYDLYLANKSKSNNTSYKTKVIDEKGNEHFLNLKALPFIPNYNFELFEQLLAKSKDDAVDVIHERSMYGADKKHMSASNSNENSWPCVKYISQKAGNHIDFRYSNANKGMFGIPKVMFGIGAGVGGIIIDKDGEYGLCQFMAGIVDTPDTLPIIQKALTSDKFVDLMASVQFSTQAYNLQVIRLLNKNCWNTFCD